MKKYNQEKFLEKTFDYENEHIILLAQQFRSIQSKINYLIVLNTTLFLFALNLNIFDIFLEKFLFFIFILILFSYSLLSLRSTQIKISIDVQYFIGKFKKRGLNNISIWKVLTRRLTKNNEDTIRKITGIEKKFDFLLILTFLFILLILIFFFLTAEEYSCIFKLLSM